MTLDDMPDEDFLVYLEWRLEAARLGTPAKPIYWRRCPVPIPWSADFGDPKVDAPTYEGGHITPPLTEQQRSPE